MEYVLKHKNIDVAFLEIRHENIVDIKEIKEKEHLPVKYEEDKYENIRLLNNWLENRGIPSSRENHEAILAQYGVDSSKELTLLGYGLNLTDHYWICDTKNVKTWEEVNFLQNAFSEKVGAILFELSGNDAVFANPDFSSNGHLRKMWSIKNDVRVLHKAGSGDIKQEPYNEYIASRIADSLGFNHVNYSLTRIRGETFSVCDCMIDENIEFIDAFKVYLHVEQRTNRYDDYIKVCERNGIANARKEVDKMIVLDYLIRNTDRNTGNYGILRNSETLKWESMAPIFDNGNSFWYNTVSTDNIIAETSSNCRSFSGTNEGNIKLITDMEWFDMSKLTGIEKLIADTLAMNPFMEKNGEKSRIDRIAGCFVQRTEKLSSLRGG
jgi:hypothetical protein